MLAKGRKVFAAHPWIRSQSRLAGRETAVDIFEDRFRDGQSSPAATPNPVVRLAGRGLLGRRFVVLLLLVFFLFRQLLLLILFLVFLSTLVSHACSFLSDCDFKSGFAAPLFVRNRREPTLYNGRANRS